MGFSTTDGVALFILGVSALLGTFGKRLTRSIGLAVMPFALAGLVLSLSHHGSAPSQGPITNNIPSIDTNNTNNTKNTNTTNNANNQSGGINILTPSDHRGCLSMQQSGINWRASCRPGNQLRLWLLYLEPIGILRTSMPNI